MIGFRTATRIVLGTVLVAGWIGTAQATTTAQQLCDNARITAWGKYKACIEAVVAKDAKGVAFDESKAFWKCRHAYFKKFASFSLTGKYNGSSCLSPFGRFTDNGDQTVTDNMSGLVWEKKDHLDTLPNSILGAHDADNRYSWSSGPPYKGDGTAFSIFLTNFEPSNPGLNVVGFAGAKDWRLPTLAELQTIMLDFTCTGAGGGVTCRCTGPCVDPTLDATNTQFGYYWSATSTHGLDLAWLVDFNWGAVLPDQKAKFHYVRAVRGGF